MHKKPGPIDTSKGYELEDLPIKGIVKGTMIFFTFTTISIIAALGYLFLVPRGIGAPVDAPVRTLPPKPNPLLQDNMTATFDLHKMRSEEKKRLGSVGWVNKENGVVHIPVENAIERAARGNR